MEGFVNKLVWACGGGVALVVVGLVSGILVFGASAKSDATKQTNAAVKIAVTEALTPGCVAAANADADFAGRLVALKAMNSYSRTDEVIVYGWTDNKDVAKACAAAVLPA